MHQFCIDNNGIAEGPYSAKEILSMNLPLETMVLDSESGEWRPLSDYNMEDYSLLEVDEAEEFLLRTYPQGQVDRTDCIQEDPPIQQPEEEVEQDGMTEEELESWRAKRREQRAKARRSDNRANGLVTMIGGLVMGGIGVLITAISDGSVIKIGLIAVGGFMALKGLLQVISGEGDDDDNQE